MAQYVLLIAGLLLVSPDADSVSYQQDGSRLATARVTNWVSGYRRPGPTVNGTGTLTAVDDRFSDSGNTVVLDGYEKLDLGVLLRVNERLTFQISGDNVTDEEGVTEGDPRDPTLPNGRFIMPASVKFSVGYEF